MFPHPSSKFLGAIAFVEHFLILYDIMRTLRKRQPRILVIHHFYFWIKTLEMSTRLFIITYCVHYSIDFRSKNLHFKSECQENYDIWLGHAKLLLVATGGIGSIINYPGPVEFPPALDDMWWMENVVFWLLAEGHLLFDAKVLMS